MTDTQDAQEIEFDLLAGWTEDAVQELGPEYAIPAGSRSPKRTRIVVLKGTRPCCRGAP